MADQILVEDLRLMLFCGVLEEEQQRRQPFSFDIAIEVDLARPSATDDIADTVHYGEVIQELDSTLSAEQLQLLERLAGRTCELILEDPLVNAVTVTVRKLRPPVPSHVASTGVTIRRTR